MPEFYFHAVLQNEINEAFLVKWCQGYYATLASFGPFSALYFAFYEQAMTLTSNSLSLTQFDATLDSV